MTSIVRTSTLLECRFCRKSDRRSVIHEVEKCVHLVRDIAQIDLCLGPDLPAFSCTDCIERLLDACLMRELCINSERRLLSCALTDDGNDTEVEDALEPGEVDAPPFKSKFNFNSRNLPASLTIKPADEIKNGSGVVEQPRKSTVRVVIRQYHSGSEEEEEEATLEKGAWSNDNLMSDEENGLSKDDDRDPLSDDEVSTDLDLSASHKSPEGAAVINGDAQPQVELSVQRCESLQDREGQQESVQEDPVLSEDLVMEVEVEMMDTIDSPHQQPDTSTIVQQLENSQTSKQQPVTRTKTRLTNQSSDADDESQRSQLEINTQKSLNATASVPSNSNSVDSPPHDTAQESSEAEETNHKKQKSSQAALVRSNRLPKFGCCQCEFTSLEKQETLQHFKERHPTCQLTVPRKGKLKGKFPLHICNLCNQTFKTRLELFHHKRRPRMRVLTCTECNIVLANVYQLKMHNRRQHKILEEYPCTLCDKVYHNPNSLAGHTMFKHTIQIHVCKECGADFRRLESLREHLHTHTGTFPYPCTLCDAKFIRLNGLKSHMRKHTKAKPYKCEHCGRSFAFAIDLKRHVPTHTGVYPFNCELCNKGFTRIKWLKQHLKAHEANKTRNRKPKGVL